MISTLSLTNELTDLIVQLLLLPLVLAVWWRVTTSPHPPTGAHR